MVFGTLLQSESIRNCDFFFGSAVSQNVPGRRNPLIQKTVYSLYMIQFDIFLIFRLIVNPRAHIIYLLSSCSSSSVGPASRSLCSEYVPLSFPSSPSLFLPLAPSVEFVCGALDVRTANPLSSVSGPGLFTKPPSSLSSDTSVLSVFVKTAGICHLSV